MKKDSLKKNFILLTSIPFVVLTLLMAWLFLQSYFNTLEQQLIVYSKDLSIEISHEVSYLMYNKEALKIDQVSKSKLNKPDVRAIAVFNADSTLISHVGPDMNPAASLYFLDSPLLTDEDLITTIKSIRMISPVYHQSFRLNKTKLEKIGHIEIEISTLNNTIKKYQATGAVTAVLFLVWFLQIFSTYFFSSKTEQALKELGDAMEEVRQGEMKVQLNLINLGPFKTVQDAFNNMTSRLNKSRNELQETLEHATDDVKETLETIEIQNIELDIARKEALEASRIKSEFLANMSHEIRTPLNSIIGFTKLLLKTPLTSRQQDHLETIRKSSNGLLFIINEILDFSKIEAGKLVLDQSPINLRNTIDDVVELLSPSANEKNLEQVIFFYSDVPDYLIGDAQRIKQVLTNLISNAIKFSDEGTIVIRIILESNDDYSAIIRFSVSDDGKGLNQEEQKNLFQAFSQGNADHFKNYGGTGLGLVISKHLAEKMGGEIGFDSEESEGSTFWFTTKLKIDPTKASLNKTKAINNLKIALFDDNKTNALSLSHLLEKEGFMHTDYKTIDALYLGIKQARSDADTYDYAIIGINQKYENNHQLIAAIQEIEKDFDCKTIILSNLIDGSKYQISLEESCNQYIHKPLTFRKFINFFTEPTENAGIQPADNVASNSNLSSDPAILKKDCKVLAVDDNLSNLKLISSFLHDLGAEVTAVDSGEKAIDEASRTEFDLILMDIRMPGIDGIEATKQIRLLELKTEGIHIPIVAVTAHAMANEKIKLLSSGMDDYITKPINETQLRFILNKWSNNLEQEPTPSSSITKEAVNNPLQNQDKIIDFDESIQLAGGKHDLAKDMYIELIATLPNDKVLIQEAQNDLEKLLNIVHKLHGGTRYCGVPSLRTAASNLETIIKNGKQEEIEPALKKLISAIDQLVGWDNENKDSFFTMLSTAS